MSRRHSPKEIERIKRIAAGEDFGKPVAQGSLAAPPGSAWEADYKCNLCGQVTRRKTLRWRTMARKLRDAQDYLQNAVSGLAHHIHETSPIMRDIVAADRNMEEVRQWLLSPNSEIRQAGPETHDKQPQRNPPLPASNG